MKKGREWGRKQGSVNCSSFDEDVSGPPPPRKIQFLLEVFMKRTQLITWVLVKPHILATQCPSADVRLRSGAESIEKRKTSMLC